MCYSKLLLFFGGSIENSSVILMNFLDYDLCFFLLQFSIFFLCSAYLMYWIWYAVECFFDLVLFGFSVHLASICICTSLSSRSFLWLFQKQVCVFGLSFFTSFLPVIQKFSFSVVSYISYMFLFYVLTFLFFFAYMSSVFATFFEF